MTSYTLAYLLGTLFFIPLWVGLYWRNPGLRREMLVMSAVSVIIFVPLEFLPWSRDWWHPATITGTRVGPEDFIYAFGNGGYMATVLVALSRRRLVIVRAPPSWAYRAAPMLALAIVSPLLFYAFGLNSFFARTAGTLLALILIFAVRPDLIGLSLLNGVVAMVIAIPAYLTIEAVFPGVIAATWDLPRLGVQRKT